jgi:hypothetical protein
VEEVGDEVPSIFRLQALDGKADKDDQYTQSNQELDVVAEVG